MKANIPSSRRSTAAAAPHPAVQAFQAWWAGLAAREQRLIGGAAVLVLLALVWWVALAPALATLREAPAAHARLGAQLQQMNRLQAQARALQAQPRANRDDAVRALDTSVRQGLGPGVAQLQPVSPANENATVAVRGAAADSLADWLAQARSNARAVPREVHLTRATATPPAAAPGAPAVAVAAPAANDRQRPHWDGTLVLGLPAAR